MATSTSAREADPQLLLKAPSSSAQMCAFHPHVQNLLKQNVCVCVCLRARMGPYMPRRWVWFVYAWYSHLLGCASWFLRRFAGFPVSTKWWKLIEIFVDSNSLPSFKQILMSSYTCVLKSLTANAKYLWDFPCKMSLPPPNMTKKKKRKMRRFVFFPRTELCDGSLAEVNEKPLIFVVQSDNKQQGMMAETLWSQQSH